MKIKILTLAVVFLGFVGKVQAVPNQSPQNPILFEDNFDTTEDWRSKQYANRSTDIAWNDTKWFSCGSFCPPNPGMAPLGWAGYRASKSHWLTPLLYPNPYVAPNGTAPSSQRDTLVIDSENAYGGTGKSLKYNVETAAADDLGSGWSAGSMYVWLGDEGYQDLYIRFKMQYPSDWIWSNGSYHAYQKMLRLISFNGDILTDDPSSIQTGACNQRISWIPDFYFNKSYPEWETYLANSTLFSDQYNQATLNCANLQLNNFIPFKWPSDGQWHNYEFHAKLNSAPGVADGLWEISIDGIKTPGANYVSQNNIAWIASGGSMTPAWNWLMLFDNLNMQIYTLGSNPEQQIRLDDIVIYKKLTFEENATLWSSSPQDGRLPLDYVIGGVDLTAPAVPNGLNVE